VDFVLAAVLPAAEVALECPMPEGTTPDGVAARGPEARLALLSSVLGFGSPHESKVTVRLVPVGIGAGLVLTF
jgi:hypothetical protein